MKFTATLLLAGKTATGIEVPAKIVEALGSGKKPAVSVTINGHTYRSAVATMGGKFMLPVSAEQRAQARVAAGDKVAVELVLDSTPREVVVPEDFAKALKRYAAARKFFDGLSYSNRRRHVLSIESAKRPETRQRRIEKAIEGLAERRA